MWQKTTEWFKVREVANNVWVIRDNTQVASYLVEGEDKSLLIDTGWSIRQLKRISSIYYPTTSHGCIHPWTSRSRLWGIQF